MDPSSVHVIEQKANWKLRKSLFSDGLELSDEKRYCLFASGEKNYENIQRPHGTGTSVSHFIIAIKCHNYPSDRFPSNVLAIVSIGIPPEQNINKNQEGDFYDIIYPVIKGIEAVLLNQLTLAERGVH